MNVTVQRPFAQLRIGQRGLRVIGVALLMMSAIVVGAMLPSLSLLGSTVVTLSLMSGVTVFVITARWGIRGLAFLLLTLGAGFVGLTGVRVSPAVAVSDLFWFAAIGLTLPLILFGKGFRASLNSPLIRAVLLLNLGAFIAGLFSPELVESQIRLAKMATATLLVPLVILYWQPKHNEVHLLTWMWVLPVVISCLYALINGPDEYSSRSSGLTTHANSLGVTAVLTLGPAIAFVFSGSKMGALLASGCIIVLLGGIMMSGSRAALMGAAVTLVAFPVILRRRDITIAMTIAAIAVLAILGTGLYEPPGVALDRLIGTEEVSSGVAASNEGRREAFSASIDRMMERPLIGWGLAQARSAHNVYLQVLESSGVIGFIGFLMVITVSLKPTIQFARRRTVSFQDQASLPAIGLSAGLIGFLFAELFSNILWERFLWFHIALLVSASSLAYVPKQSSARVMTDNDTRDRSIPMSIEAVGR